MCAWRRGGRAIKGVWRMSNCELGPCVSPARKPCGNPRRPTPSSSPWWKHGRSVLHWAKHRCCGACSRPARSPALRRPKRLSSSTACVGASSKSSAHSRVMVWPSTTASSSTPSVCSISQLSDWLAPFVRSSLSTLETVVPAPQATLLTRTSLSPSNASRKGSKAKHYGRKTRTQPALLLLSPGLRHASAAGIATTNRQDQRPCAMAGTVSLPHSMDMPLLHNNKFRESHSPKGEVGLHRQMQSGWGDRVSREGCVPSPELLRNSTSPRWGEVKRERRQIDL